MSKVQDEIKRLIECPQCGNGSSALVTDKPVGIVRTMGEAALMRCPICDYRWLRKSALEGRQ